MHKKPKKNVQFRLISGKMKCDSSEFKLCEYMAKP